LVHTCIGSELIRANVDTRRGAAGAWTPLHSLGAEGLEEEKEEKEEDRQTEIERQKELTVSFLSVHHPLAQEELGSSS
jgi:hypothetical protein